MRRSSQSPILLLISPILLEIYSKNILITPFIAQMDCCSFPCEIPIFLSSLCQTTAAVTRAINKYATTGRKSRSRLVCVARRFGARRVDARRRRRDAHEVHDGKTPSSRSMRTVRKTTIDAIAAATSAYANNNQPRIFFIYHIHVHVK